MGSFLYFLRLPDGGHFAVAVAVGKNDRIPGSDPNQLGRMLVSKIDSVTLD